MKKNKIKANKITGGSSEDFTPLNNNFPIVGIGASAGGLKAFEAFFSAMPAETKPGMAFVLVQHLAPDHKSILSDIISRYTSMDVFEVEDGMEVKVNCAYIIPPGFDMAFLNGNLQLLEPSVPRGQRLPIDFFFRSLAQDQRESSIGVVLSGTGSDGSQGVRAIKGEAGMVIAQTPESAEYSGMPHNAIATGLVDFKLKPDEMLQALIDYVNRTFRKEQDFINPTEKTINSLKKIFILLRSQTGHDFSQYKSNTIIRRIERRMAVQQINNIDKYVKYLQQENIEIETLFKDLLIGVTNFFRDTEAFQALEDSVIPKLFEGKSPGSSVRIWSPGCSSGEEACSMAILLAEYMEKKKQSFTLQVFATDIDPQAIAKARTGIYSTNISQDITKERLARFFNTESGRDDGVPHSYRIIKNIRDLLIFSEQDIIKDPPFSKLDLISCRNLMIYMNSDLQKKLIPLFHYALNPGGMLFLGTSETIGEYTDLFTVVDRKNKIYQRKINSLKPNRMASAEFFPPIVQRDNLILKASMSKPRSNRPPLRELAEKTILKQIAPSSALVNDIGDIFYIHGHTGMFLEPATGEVGTYNIIKMAREGLQRELAKALQKTTQTKEIIRCTGLEVKTNGHFTKVDLTICPAETTPDNINSQALYLVLMTQGPSVEPSSNEGPSIPPQSTRNSIVSSLIQELKEKEEYLQNANEELDTSNEELKSTNEELQSVNEELQSTNEELETSKEELQSMNEELTTVNAELQSKISDLSTVNNDMNNLLAGTGIATVFVDHQSKIMRFTPNANAIINLVKSDVGRSVNHFANNLIGYETLLGDIQSVLDTLIPVEKTVQDVKGIWYMMRILPYRTIDNVIEGAVLTFVDVTDKTKAEKLISTQLTEKSIILKEVHHRIKNNIASIESLLSIKSESVDNPETVTILQDAISQVRTMRILYDKLIINEDYNDVSVMNYVNSLIESIVALYPSNIKISIKKHIDDFTLSSKQIFSLGIVMNELLINISKYAFKDRSSGKINISLTNKKNQVTLEILDNGVGFPEGIDFKDLKGFGLILVEMLSKQLGGTFLVESNNGTRYVLKFDL